MYAKFHWLISHVQLSFQSPSVNVLRLYAKFHWLISHVQLSFQSPLVNVLRLYAKFHWLISRVSSLYQSTDSAERTRRIKSTRALTCHRGRSPPNFATLRNYQWSLKNRGPNHGPIHFEWNCCFQFKLFLDFHGEKRSKRYLFKIQLVVLYRTHLRWGRQHTDKHTTHWQAHNTLTSTQH